MTSNISIRLQTDETVAHREAASGRLSFLSVGVQRTHRCPATPGTVAKEVSRDTIKETAAHKEAAHC